MKLKKKQIKRLKKIRKKLKLLQNIQDEIFYKVEEDLGISASDDCSSNWLFDALFNSSNKKEFKRCASAINIPDDY